MEVCSPCRLQPQWTRICMKDRSRPCCSRSDLPLYAEFIAGKVALEVGNPETPRHLKSWLLGKTTGRRCHPLLPRRKCCNLLTYQPPFFQHDVVKPQPNATIPLEPCWTKLPVCGVGEGFTLPGCSRCNLALRKRRSYSLLTSYTRHQLVKGTSQLLHLISQTCNSISILNPSTHAHVSRSGRSYPRE